MKISIIRVVLAVNCILSACVITGVLCVCPRPFGEIIQCLLIASASIVLLNAAAFLSLEDE